MSARASKKEPEPAPAVDEVALFEAKVKRMREMGVTEWGDIKLGPERPPEPKPLTAEQKREAIEKEEERKRDVMFAASHIKPALRAKR